MGSCCMKSASPTRDDSDSDDGNNPVFVVYNQAISKFRQTEDFNEELDETMRERIRQGIREARSANRTDRIDISFDNIALREKGSLVLAELILKASAIRSISARNTELSSRGVVEIGSSLRYNHHILALNLAENHLGEKGVRGLLKFFFTSKLSRLNLSKTGLDEECGCLITNRIFLSSNNTLEELDLSHNNFHDRTLESFCAAIHTHIHLKMVNIEGNGGPAPPPRPLATIGSRTSRRMPAGLTLPNPAPPPIPPSDISDTKSVEQAAVATSQESYLSYSECQERMTAALERNTVVADVVDSVISSLFDSCGEAGTRGSFPSINNSIASNSSDYEQSHRDGKMLYRSIAGSPYCFGFAEFRGRRQKMEDIILLKQNFRNNAEEHLFGIFDGHGGVECAKFAHSAFPDCFGRELNSAEESCTDKPNGSLRDTLSGFVSEESGEAEFINRDEVEKSLVNAFRSIQRKCTQFEIQNGTCALISYFRFRTLFVASVGDSRALLIRGFGRGASAMWLSDVVTPLSPSERDRIEKNGGFVTDNGRVCGVLAVSRAIGDIQYSDILSSEPIITRFEIPSDPCWLVLGCDGVWDVLGREDVLDLMKYVSDPIRAAQVLRDAAFNRDSRDNISVVCVRFALGG